MEPVSAHVNIQASREQVFAYLADVANYPEFLGGLLGEYRLTREESVGVGAGARFKLALRLNRFAWFSWTLKEADAPHVLKLSGRGGKYDRTALYSEIELMPAGSSGVRVTWTIETETKMLSDSLMEDLSFQSPLLRWRLQKGLIELRSIFEEGRVRGQRASIAGGARKPSSGVELGFMPLSSSLAGHRQTGSASLD